jgi:hypothetical protein
MKVNPYLQLAASVILFCLGFFSLIININFLSSSLQNTNRNLKEERQRLQNILITREQEISSDLNQDIENRLEIGTIERIEPNTEVDISEIQIDPLAREQDTDSQDNNQSATGSNPGFIVR